MDESKKIEGTKMKNQVTLGQLLASIVAILISVFGAWMTLNKDVVSWSNEQDNQAKQIIEIKAEIKDARDRRESDMKEIRESLSEIKEKLINKQDR